MVILMVRLLRKVRVIQNINHAFNLSRPIIILTRELARELVISPKAIQQEGCAELELEPTSLVSVQ